MTRPIQGIIPALVTAYDARGELDVKLERALVARLLTQGVHGLFVGGTTGEFPFLTLDERERLAEAVASEVSGQVPMIVHVGTPRVKDAVLLAQHAARVGAEAVSTVPPYYYSYRTTAVLAYVEEIARATDLPCYYYHIPTCSGQPLDHALFEKLLELPNLAGVKYSQTDLSEFKRLKQLAGSDFQFFCGVDTLVFPALLFGADGAVGSSYNFLAPLFLRLWQAYDAKEYALAREAQARADAIIAILECYPMVAAVKETLHLLGVDVGAPRPPLSRLTAAESEQIGPALTQAGLSDLTDQNSS